MWAVSVVQTKKIAFYVFRSENIDFLCVPKPEHLLFMCSKPRKLTLYVCRNKKIDVYLLQNKKIVFGVSNQRILLVLCVEPILFICFEPRKLAVYAFRSKRGNELLCVSEKQNRPSLCAEPRRLLFALLIRKINFLNVSNKEN